MLNVRELIGLSEEDAVKKIREAGFRPRVRRRNQESYFGTMDYRTDRVNLEIDKGKVTKAHIG